MRSHRGLVGLALVALAIVPSLAAFAPEVSEAQEKSGPLAAVIEVGRIDTLAANVLEKQIRRALDRQAEVIVIEIDGGGGELDAARDIAHNLADLPSQVHPLRTFAWIRGDATGPGTVLALGCENVIVDPVAAKLGNVLRIRETTERTAALEERVARWKKEVQTLAEKRGIAPDLTAKLVDPAVDLLRVDVVGANGRPSTELVARATFDAWPQAKRDAAQIKSIGEPGRPLVLSGEEVRSLGVAHLGAKDLSELREEIRRELSYDALSVERVPSLWWESVVRFITWTPVKVLLFIIGVIAFVISVLHPGIGAPEITAVVAFGLCFFGGYLIGLATAIELIVFVIGAALVAAEILSGLPTHGALAVVGGFLVFASLLLSLQSFVVPSTAEEWAIFRTNLAATAAALLVSLAGISVAVRLLPKTRLAKGLIHTDVQSAEIAPTGPLPGTRGVAATLLRPVGKVELDGSSLARGELASGSLTPAPVLFDAQAESGLIEKGTPIVVVGRRGNEVVVAPLREGATS